MSDVCWPIISKTCWPNNVIVSVQNGYDAEPVGSINKDLFCSICLKLMRDAVESECGHGLCNGCFQSLMLNQRAAQCPICRKHINENMVRPAQIIRRMVLAQHVACSEKANGCNWTGELSHMQPHLDKTCLYALVDCHITNCRTRIRRINLESHTEKCEYRLVSCTYCKNKHPQNTTERHIKQCPMCPINCPAGCHAVQLRQNMSKHLEECPNAIVECDYSSVGCKENVSRKEYENHIEIFMKKHMLLLLEDSKKNKERLKRLEEPLQSRYRTTMGGTKKENITIRSGVFGSYNHIQ